MGQMAGGFLSTRDFIVAAHNDLSLFNNPLWSRRSGFNNFAPPGHATVIVLLYVKYGPNQSADYAVRLLMRRTAARQRLNNMAI